MRRLRKSHWSDEHACWMGVEDGPGEIVAVPALAGGLFGSGTIAQARGSVASVPLSRRSHSQRQEESLLILGYAALWGCSYDREGFAEYVHRGCFATSLQSGRHILALIEHDRQRVLGSTAEKVLALQEDERGLFVALAVNTGNPLAADLVAGLRTDRLCGMSYERLKPRFRVHPYHQGSHFRGRRDVDSCELTEVSFVARPGNWQTLAVVADDLARGIVPPRLQSDLAPQRAAALSYLRELARKHCDR